MSQYGSYSKIGNRRRASGNWQWMIIGFLPGILCGGILIFGVLLSGAFDGLRAQALPTYTAAPQVVLVVTATPDPNQPTQTPFVITATPGEAQADAEVVIVAPSATPTNDAASTPVVVATADTGGATTQGSLDQLTPQVPVPTVAVAAPPTSSVPQQLLSIASNMANIPATTFTMGTTALEVLDAVDQCVNRDQGLCNPSYGEDSSPQFQVQLNTYQMEVTEVTFQQYVAFLNYLRSTGRNHLTGCAGFLCIQTVNENSVDAVITFDGANYNAPQGLLNHPVYSVTWYGAQAYCNALGRRLPTEAEWEYSARGPNGFIYPWGNEWSSQLAKTRIPRDAPPGTVPVGSYPQNGSPFGMLDMAGNLAEWVNDWYDETYYRQMANQPQPIFNPQGPPIALRKVVRGGSWDSLPFFARTVHRQYSFPAPDSPADSFPRWVGFRCAADASSAAVAPAGVNPALLGSDLPTTPNAQPGLPGEEATPATDGGSRG